MSAVSCSDTPWTGTEPIWLWQHEMLHLVHRAEVLVGDLDRRTGMSGYVRIWKLIHRLRCSVCGANVEVEIGP